MYKSRKRLAWRLWAILAVAMVGLVLVGAQGLNRLYGSMMADRQVKTRNVVEIAYGIAEHYHKRAQAGELSDADAKRLALAEMETLRYEGQEYFWVNDMTPVMIMHPFAKQLLGKNLSEMKDPNGKRLFVDFVTMVKRQGAGFVDYLWPKPGFDKPVPKVSYVKGFMPWGWVIGSGIYLDDVAANFRRELAVSGGIALVIAVIVLGLGWVIIRGITRPLNTLTVTLGRLAERDWDAEITGAERGDEIGDIARAVAVLRDSGMQGETLQRQVEDERRRNEDGRTAQEALLDQAIGQIVTAANSGNLAQRIDTGALQGTMATVGGRVNDLLETIAGVIANIKQAVAGLAAGNLQARMAGRYEGDYALLQSDLNGMADKIADVIRRIIEAAETQSSTAAEISTGSQDLASRTESQAASIEETAASMHEITATVKQNADNAQAANQLAMAARDTAEKGGSVVKDAVAAVSRIEDSAQKIADIVGLIDEIAFQTNLLALNASVEAARAGEAGKGFAVVAQEVRALAQRSANASKDIKTLINESNAQVKTGAELVNQTGASLTEIVTAIKKVSDIVAEIAAASREQAGGLEQVNTAVGSMDEMTQRNGALVEQTSASAQALSQQAMELADLVAFFRSEAGATASAAAASRAPAAKPALAKAAPAPSTPASPKPGPAKPAARPAAAPRPAAADDDDWQEF
ncbi:MAG TPA: methyl-accepting chemotaxis protein [Ferrovibrio sp.]|uniref:methyl-accepting chemotaxis protein n=1 Tax=Ferrovibrio sp. TaxID=1917215 RepID=UPI002ED12A1E